MDAEREFTVPQSDVGKEYYAQQQVALIDGGNNPWESNNSQNDVLIRIAREAKHNREQPLIKKINLKYIKDSLDAAAPLA